MNNNHNKCDRCEYEGYLEKHHIKHRIDGGTDEPNNLTWLCRGCHNFQHAKDEIIKSIHLENTRLGILNKQLSSLLFLNTPKLIKERGYTPYIKSYSMPITPALSDTKLNERTIPKNFLKISEATHVFEIHKNTLYKWLRDGVIRFVRVNKVILIPISEIKRLQSKAQ